MKIKAKQKKQEVNQSRQIVQNRNEITVNLLSSMPKGSKILDCGAGEGHLSKILYEKGYQVEACDFKPEAFKYQKVSCRYADLNKKTPYANKSFAAIICLEVIEHLENPWLLMREFSRILKNNGLVIISSPNVANITARIFFLATGKIDMFKEMETEHINPISYWELRRILKDTGFKILHLKGDLDVTKNVSLVTHIKNPIIKLVYLIFFQTTSKLYNLIAKPEEKLRILFNSFCYLVVAKKTKNAN